MMRLWLLAFILNGLLLQNSVCAEPFHKSLSSDLSFVVKEGEKHDEALDRSSVADKSKQFLRVKLGESESIDFVFSNLTLDRFLTLFADEYNLNIVNNAPTVKKPLSFSLKGIHPIEVFDTLLGSWGCGWYIDEGVILVSKQYPTKVYNMNYVKVSDVLPNIRSITKLKLNVIEKSNTFVAQGPVMALAAFSEVIKKLDVPPKQVMIEAKIYEMTGDVNRTFGIGLNHPYQNATIGNNAQTNGLAGGAGGTAAGMFVRVIRGDLQAQLEALQTDANSNILASPKLLVTNYETAKINTGQRLGFTTTVTTVERTIETVQFLDTGINLEFTPQITDNDEILMKIKPEISEGRIEANIPRKSSAKTETSVMVKNGQSIVIGGLIQEKVTDTITGVPFLMDIPILNIFFKKTENRKEKREILMIITPHIVSLEDSSNAATRQIVNK
jgi:type IV pilus assembly protein PilQ